MPGRIEELGELLARQPVALLPGLRGRLQFKKRVGHSVAIARPAHEGPQQQEAAVVGGRRRVKAPAVVIEVVHDRLLIEQLSRALLARSPGEELIDGDAVRVHRALAALRALQAPKPRLAVTGDQAP